MTAYTTFKTREDIDKVCIVCLRSATCETKYDPTLLALIRKADVEQGARCKRCNGSTPCRIEAYCEPYNPPAYPPIPEPPSRSVISYDEWCDMIDDPEQE